ncbi:hypothetical protein NC994_23720 [Trichocoleus sp. AS-A1]
MREALANASFEPSPTLLNSIEVRRIGGQIQQPQASLNKQLCNASAMMKRRVINNYHLSQFQHGDEAAL